MKILNYLRKKWQKTTEVSLEGYYQKLDETPIYNFHKALNGNIEYLRIVKKKGSNYKDAIAFEKLFDIYIEKYPDKKQEEMLEIKKRIIDLRAKYILTGDRFLLNYITIEEASIKIDSNDVSNIDLEDVMVSFMKILNLTFIPNKKTTTIETYKSLEKQCQTILRNRK